MKRLNVVSGMIASMALPFVAAVFAGCAGPARQHTARDDGRHSDSAPDQANASDGTPTGEKGCSGCGGAASEHMAHASGPSRGHGPAGHAGAPPAPALVNTVCPIMGGKLDSAKATALRTRPWQGKQVGFCCAGCPKAWDRLSQPEKEAKLASVLGAHAGHGMMGSDAGHSMH